jgi:hypothetical protein
VLADNTWEIRLHLYVPLPNQNMILLQPSPCQTGHNHLYAPFAHRVLKPRQRNATQRRMGHIAANMCDFVAKGDNVVIEYTTRETRQLYMSHFQTGTSHCSSHFFRMLDMIE